MRAGPAVRYVALALGLGLILSVAACGSESFGVVRSAERPTGVPEVSVFGVFRSGRMSAEWWHLVQSHLPLSFRECAAFYDYETLDMDSALASSVDDYTRNNGIPDELLDQLAPMAKGDRVLVIMVTPIPRKVCHRDPKVRRQDCHRFHEVNDGTEVIATLFSVHARRTIAAMNMRYRGSEEDALASFAEHLEAEVPDASCAGWYEDGRIDDATIVSLQTP